MAQERTGGRLPPHNAEAEQSVLGCMLLEDVYKRQRLCFIKYSLLCL